MEIPTDFNGIKSMDPLLANLWRETSRDFFEDAFANGYLVTDAARYATRTFYVLTQGEATLQE
jgi:predicted GNAT superfamily acetyltransferase